MIPQKFCAQNDSAEVHDSGHHDLVAHIGSCSGVEISGKHRHLKQLEAVLEARVDKLHSDLVAVHTSLRGAPTSVALLCLTHDRGTLNRIVHDSLLIRGVMECCNLTWEVE
jgi:hypothetical protein